MEGQESQFLFAYGTLRSDQPESLQHGPKSISRSPAQMAGKLYQLEEGYPILVVPPSSMLVEASRQWAQDWAKAVAAIQTRRGDLDKIGSPRVQGELIEVPLEAGALSKPDRWEGFKIGSQSVYRRIVVPVIRAGGPIVPAWVYASTKAPRAAIPLAEEHWNRSNTLKCE